MKRFAVLVAIAFAVCACSPDTDTTGSISSCARFLALVAAGLLLLFSILLAIAPISWAGRPHLVWRRFPRYA
jgi:hypothetical protein